MIHTVVYLTLFGIVYGIPEETKVTPIAVNVNPYVRNSLVSKYNSYYNPATVPILSYSNTHGIDGSYSYSFSTGDGKQAQENGFVKDAFIANNGEPHGTQVKEGSYSYVSPDGTPIQLEYVADENGFRHGGVHFSTAGKIGAGPFFGNSGNQIYDPRFNYNNPYYRNPGIGSYPIKPLDQRYLFNQRYNQYQPIFNNAVKPQTIKGSI